MRGWKKWLAVVGACLLSLGLSGCGISKELHERILIHGIGVDKTDKGFLVTVRSSSSTEDKGEEYFETEGNSVLEALSNLSLSTGREPFYSHNYVVVFGKRCAVDGLDQCMDFFVRYYNTRPAVQMYLAKDTAKEILSVKKDDAYLKMWEIQQMGKSGQYNGKALWVDILDFVNGVKREGASPLLPVLKAGEEGVEIDSTAYFEGYRLKGFLSLKETRGFLAAKDRLQSGEIVVQREDFGTVTLTISKSREKTKVELKQGKPVFHLKIWIEADVSAISGGRNRLEEDFYQDLEETVSDRIKKEVEKVMAKAIGEDRCDIFGFGNLLYQKHPRYWKEIASRWEEEMVRCQYEIEVDTKVIRMEQENLNLAGS